MWYSELGIRLAVSVGCFELWEFIKGFLHCLKEGIGIQRDFESAASIELRDQAGISESNFITDTILALGCLEDFFEGCETLDDPFLSP